MRRKVRETDENQVRVKFQNERLHAFSVVIRQMIEGFVPSKNNDYETLLKQSMIELNSMIFDSLKNHQVSYVLHINKSNVLAFYYVFNMLDMSKDKYAHIIVESLINKIKVL